LLASCFLFFFVDGYMNNNILIKLPAVKELTTFSSATIFRLISKGEFPKQIKLAERSSAWLLEEVNSWIEEKKDARDGGES
jgi:prophage regulatory protein